MNEWDETTEVCERSRFEDSVAIRRLCQEYVDDDELTPVQVPHPGGAR